jgi:hypothetical protein
MPLWTVQTEDGQEHRAEAGMLVTEGGSLLALSEDGLLTRAWAPGHWRTAQLVTGAHPRPADRGVSEANADFGDHVLVGLPQR